MRRSPARGAWIASPHSGFAMTGRDGVLGGDGESAVLIVATVWAGGYISLTFLQCLPFWRDVRFSFLVKAYSRLNYVFVEVSPVGVCGFDQGAFLEAGAGFELFFSGDGGGHVGVAFEMDEDVAAVFGGEAGGDGFAVFGDSDGEVGGYAYVEGAVAGAGHDVDGGLFGHVGAGCVDGLVVGWGGRRSPARGAWIASPHSGFAMTGRDGVLFLQRLSFQRYQRFSFVANSALGYIMSSYRSRQSGFVDSIRASFLKREPALSCFSRAMAVCMSA